MKDNTILDQIAERSSATGIVRWHDRRMIAGVARGIAARYDVDPVVVRVGFIIAAFLGSLGIAAYLLAWVLLADDRGHVPLLHAARDRAAASIVLVVIATLSVLGFIAGVGNDRGGRLVGLLVLAGIGVLVWRASERRRAGNAPTTTTYGGAAAAQHASAGASEGSPPNSAAAPVGAGAGSVADPATGTAAGLATGGPGAAARAPIEPARLGDPSGMPVITPWGGRDGERIATYAAGAATRGNAAPPQAVRPPTPVAAVVAPRPRRRSLGWRAWLLCGGLAIGSSSLTREIGLARGLAPLPAQTLALGVACVVVGLAIVVFGLKGYWTSGVAPVAAIVAALALGAPTAAGYVGPDAAMGETTWRPASASELDRAYTVGAGEGRLDLTQLSAADLANKTVQAKVGLGELRIVVPSDVRVEVRHHVGLGQLKSIDVDGTTVVRDGAAVHGTDSFGSGPTVVIDLQVGLGEALVERTRR